MRREEHHVQKNQPQLICVTMFEGFKIFLHAANMLLDSF